MIQLMKNMLKLYGNRKNEIILSFVANIFNAIFLATNIMAIIYVSNEIIKDVRGIEAFTTDKVWPPTLILIIGFLGRIVFTQISENKKYSSSYSVGADVRIDIGNTLRKVPMGYFTENSVGEITACLTTVLKDIETYGIFALDKIVGAAFEGLIVSIFLLFVDWRIGVLSIIGIIVGFSINRAVRKRSLELAPKRQSAQSHLADAILEYIQGASVIKVYGRRSEAAERIDSSIEDMQAANIFLEKGLLKILPFFNLSFKFFATLIVLASVYFFIGGSLSLSSAIMLIVSNFIIYQALELGGNIASILRLFEINMGKIQAIQSLPVLEAPEHSVLPAHFDIEFDHVHFAYGETPTLTDMSFRIPEGTSTAIVGPSGSGKTTVCNLIARFWDVDGGSVRIGGTDVKNIPVDDLLSQISMVFQKVYLFEDTVENNIKFGCPSATRAHVIEAAKRARCHDFIMKLPEGYDTVIKEGGASLSGGEKQRISIARAMIKDAPIVILDEATSNVDPENEKHLLEAIDALCAGKTKIAIAHRLSSVRHADQILVVNDGRLEQAGTHETLLNQPGTYRDFIDKRRKAVSWQLS